MAFWVRGFSGMRKTYNSALIAGAISLVVSLNAFATFSSHDEDGSGWKHRPYFDFGKPIDFVGSDIPNFAGGFPFANYDHVIGEREKLRLLLAEGFDWLSQWNANFPETLSEFLASCNDDYPEFRKRWGHGHPHSDGDGEWGYTHETTSGVGFEGASPVPVPASAWLFGSALALISVVQRKRR